MTKEISKLLMHPASRVALIFEEMKAVIKITKSELTFPINESWKKKLRSVRQEMNQRNSTVFSHFSMDYKIRP